MLEQSETKKSKQMNWVASKADRHEITITIVNHYQPLCQEKNIENYFFMKIVSPNFVSSYKISYISCFFCQKKFHEMVTYQMNIEIADINTENKICKTKLLRKIYLKI